MTGRNPLYRPVPTSWQPPRPRCECAQLRCRLARAEAERDALAQALVDMADALVDVRTDLGAAGA